MPGIVLTVSGKPDAALTNRLAADIADLTCKVLKKELSRTSVLVRYQPPEQWFIAGRALAEDGRHAFKLEVTITDETNTKAEKATYHAEAFALLSRLIGNLHPHSNIHVIDCRASAYGYAGVTQEEHRFRASAVAA
ncbi:4-oxalocrotonate tautomerase [Rhodopseudomonas sp. AAP120]|uniref:tautomerase family protein n=1 Tax=Rhodopseudomonas sp. AAP120 TaxID=1523430 RepID=UPI0006B9B37A|nr:tautomerase family protein [Rhodopseudomonas sp. AAP120]KPG01561.1 4-oxalocrotonate tautomerase [Rhodopseudomonas sp. AAP120]